MLKLAFHFNQDVRLAVYAQGVKTIEELLILLSQSEHIGNTKYENTTDPPTASKGGGQKRGAHSGSSERERVKLRVVILLTPLMLLNMERERERGKSGEPCEKEKVIISY